jgi:hypothetical protein
MSDAEEEDVWADDPLVRRIRRRNAKAAAKAAALVEHRPSVVEIKVSRFTKNEYLADLDVALEALGYTFAGWDGPRRVRFRRDAAAT